MGRVLFEEVIIQPCVHAARNEEDVPGAARDEGRE